MLKLRKRFWIIIDLKNMKNIRFREHEKEQIIQFSTFFYLSEVITSYLSEVFVLANKTTNVETNV